MKIKTFLAAIFLTIVLVVDGCSHGRIDPKTAERIQIPPGPAKTVVDAAISQVNQTVRYDPAYTKIAYPGGDVPIEKGVCTDVVVRAFRKAGVDLQKEVHEDMVKNFNVYPHKWGLAGPDSNIDHRRVPNLMKFFDRKGKDKPMTTNPSDYLPGDVIAWDLSGGQTHVGLVTDIPSRTSSKLMIVHNIGSGAQIEDVMFNWKMIGHYRYF